MIESIEDNPWSNYRFFNSVNESTLRVKWATTTASKRYFTSFKIEHYRRYFMILITERSPVATSYWSTQPPALYRIIQPVIPLPGKFEK